MWLQGRQTDGLTALRLHGTGCFAVNESSTTASLQFTGSMTGASDVFFRASQSNSVYGGQFVKPISLDLSYIIKI